MHGGLGLVHWIHSTQPRVESGLPEGGSDSDWVGSFSPDSERGTMRTD
jgi:hypothetical protein